MSRSIVFLAVFGLLAGFASGEEAWIGFGDRSTPSATEVAITRSDLTVLEFDLDVPGLMLEDLKAEGREFTKISIPGAGQIGKIGAPLLPAFRRFVEVPEHATVRITHQVVDWEEFYLSDLGFSKTLYPVQLPRPKCKGQADRDWRFSFKNDSYAGMVQHELVTLEKPVEMRDHRMVRLTFSPVKYNFESGQLIVANRVVVKLEFIDGRREATIAKKKRLSSRSFDAFVGRNTLNLGFADPTTNGPGEWQYPNDAPIEFLVITPAEFAEDLRPFVDWKTTCGYKVTVATTDTTGTTTSEIKTYLTALYGGPTPPVYILMIGDSPDVLPTYTPSGGGVGGTDLPFVQVAGDDIYPDMMIARWPIDDRAELINMMEKTLFYQRPTAHNSAWLNRALFLAGDDYENWSVTSHQDVIAELMAPAPNSADCDLWHGNPDNPTTTDLMNSIDMGLGWAVYSAHSGPSGWMGDPAFSVDDMLNLANFERYSIGIGHSCESNRWADHDDVFGEVTVTQPASGFVSYWGSSNITHWIGDDWLERGFFDALFESDMVGSQIPELDGQFSNIAACYSGLTSVSLQGAEDENYYWPMYNLFGDPTLDPFTRQPTAINVGAPSSIEMEPTDTFTVTVADSSGSPVGGALVAASQNGDLLGAGFSNSVGVAIFHIDQPVTGMPLLVRVTAHNYLPTDEIVVVNPSDEGRMYLNKAVYPCSAVVEVDVYDLNAVGPFEVKLQAKSRETTKVLMTEVGEMPGHFQGTSVLGDELVVSHGEILIATYKDRDTGAGWSDIKTASAEIDCAGPTISNVKLKAVEDRVTVKFDTDEPGTTVVTYGPSIPPIGEISSGSLTTFHSVLIENLESCTGYNFQISSVDVHGNLSIDANGGQYYYQETTGFEVLLSETFDSDPHWEIDNGGNEHGWTFGVPLGGGGEYGGPDPTAGFTGTYVYGVNLAGDYDNSLTENQLKLTTPSIDSSKLDSVYLSFRRWLGVEDASYDHARIQVSIDGGSSWITIWENSGWLEDRGWSEQVIDLTSYAAGKDDVRIRWTQGSTDDGWSFCGWNIDDVVVYGSRPCQRAAAIFVDQFESGTCDTWGFRSP